MTDAERDTQASREELLEQVESQAQQIQQLQRQLDWLKRQVFGRKSEKRLEDSPHQQYFEELFPSADGDSTPLAETVAVPSHQRRKRNLAGTPEDSGLRFDENEVPIKEIAVSAPELEGPEADQYEVVRYENTYRLAQRPASYVVLKYTRPITKHKETKALTTTPAPANVLDKSFADVSFLAGLVVDKLVYHQPLYRQHQRLKASAIEVSRATLTNLVERIAQLLEPIANAVLDSILLSHTLAMDETPTKAGRSKQAGHKRGKMKTGYYWPLYGDRDEVFFSFSSSRAAAHVRELLSEFEGTLLSDGYKAYELFCEAMAKVTHAQCWSHTRRYFEAALDDEPDEAHKGLDFIATLYKHDEHVKTYEFDEEKTLEYRGAHSKPVVEEFLEWCREVQQRPDLKATDSPLLTAVNYALKREEALKVFLSDPSVPLDTNHLERTLRVMPMGRKNWLFSWSELGAHYVGIIQTLLSTCRLQGVDPYRYLVDVLQRVDRHPADRVHELTPRLWKEHFADQRLKSDLEL